MLQNAYFLAKIGADTAENEQHFAEIFPKTASVAARLIVVRRARRRLRRGARGEPRRGAPRCGLRPGAFRGLGG